MGDQIKICVYINTGYPSAKHEDEVNVDREYWMELDQEQREAYLDELSIEYLWRRIDCGAYVVGDE